MLRTETDTSMILVDNLIEKQLIRFFIFISPNPSFLDASYLIHFSSLFKYYNSSDHRHNFYQSFLFSILIFSLSLFFFLVLLLLHLLSFSTSTSTSNLSLIVHVSLLFSFYHTVIAHFFLSCCNREGDDNYLTCTVAVMILGPPDPPPTSRT